MNTYHNIALVYIAQIVEVTEIPIYHDQNPEKQTEKRTDVKFIDRKPLKTDTFSLRILITLCSKMPQNIFCMNFRSSLEQERALVYSALRRRV